MKKYPMRINLNGEWVEMEALAGASAACLTIYDMLKYTGKAMIISQIKLLEKTGGKSGDYKRRD